MPWKKGSLNKKDIVILVILMAFISIGGYMLWGALLMNTRIGGWLPNGFFTWGLAAILGFDVLWIAVLFKLWPHGSIRLRIYLTAIVLALSVSVLFSSLAVKAFADSMH
jgi:hypothetical protein